MPDLAPLLALGLIAAPCAWTVAWRFRQAHQGQDQFLAGRRFVLRRYRHTRDGRGYDPARNPEVARLLGEDPTATRTN